jgi:hypothetical protein
MLSIVWTIFYMHDASRAGTFLRRQDKGGGGSSDSNQD